MKIGYMRISTEDQKIELQKDALKIYGCDKIFKDEVSGSIVSRTGLDKCLASLKRGDTLVVWKMDRLGRTVRQLKDIVDDFEKKNIAFCSLTESIDTSTPAGKLFFHMLAAFAEFEREVLRERTKAGLAAAKARGSVIGRIPPPPEAISLARSLRERNFSYDAIGQELARNGFFVMSKNGVTDKVYKPASVRHMLKLRKK